MQNEPETYDEIKNLLNLNEFRQILICALSQWNLARLVNKLKLNQKEVKTTTLPATTLAGTLAEKALSDPLIFREIGEFLDPYCIEAREAVQNPDLLKEYHDTLYQEKGRRQKIMVARLIWALLKEPSTKRRFEGKAMLVELSDINGRGDSANIEWDDGDEKSNQKVKISDQNTQKAILTKQQEQQQLKRPREKEKERHRAKDREKQKARHLAKEREKQKAREKDKGLAQEREKQRIKGQDRQQKREQDRGLVQEKDRPQLREKGKSIMDSNPELTKQKMEIERLVKENAKYRHQTQEVHKSAATIKDLEKKLKVLEREKLDILKRMGKEYVEKKTYEASKKEVNILKKENVRIHRLLKGYERADKTVEPGKGHQSFLMALFHKIIPSPCRQSIVKTGKDCKVGVFVDVQNMFYSAKNLYHGRLDFEKFLSMAIQGRKLIKAIAYVVKTPEIDQTKFINLLKSNYYEVKTLDLKTGMNGFAKGNWDVGMVMDISELSSKLDVIVLASGDGDFVPLVKSLQKKGIRVEVYGFTYNTAIDLKDCADQFYPIQEDILIKDQHGNVKQH